MNGELLSVLEHIEREKGISKEILIDAVESALVSAARKVIGQGDEDEINVKMDTETGAIKVFAGEKEIKSAEFGRIAAQTAKQVIIQKIREAERDVIFAEFHTRKGTIVTGGVHRFDKGNIIVDLGKAEALLPRSELLPRERYKQGERIKAFVVDVERTPKGSCILLSRKDVGMVKKLFELEIPEIGDGIVEIKAIAREPGDRTKIAVLSKDGKVDSVGACVGMRGQRVKNIVGELQGEKIDIVRYSDDIQEYIKGALSPAEIAHIKIDSDQKKAEVIVEDDQLSLAIGRHGQNVKLASKLVGFEIDIRSNSDADDKKKAKEESELSISDLPGVGAKAEGLLNKAGFKEIEDIANAKLEDLIDIKGIGKKTAEKILESAKDFME
ncbi:MAG: transcription termination factor NusA [Candidatus Orphnella occulta]|nr:transcription termination factor NusA [Candidatus Orphnella occulta]MDP8296598.1 transcription termination factor NusA [Candidatus Orphnella occulta]